MFLLSRDLDSINAETIYSLLEEIPSTENRYIELKEAVDFSDRGKKQLVAEICAFANDRGGHLIVGIRRDGTPVGVSGDPEELIRRIETVIQSNVEPRLRTLDIKAVTDHDRRTLIVVRVRYSPDAPHMITTGESRFYRRTSVGKDPMDYWEIRDAFLASTNFAERVRAFQAHRLDFIKSGESVIPEPTHGLLFLQIVPFSAFTLGSGIDLMTVWRRRSLLETIQGPTSHHQFNIDGILGWVDLGQNPEVNAWSYVQLFRYGILEFADQNYFLRGDRPVPSKQLQGRIMKVVKNSIELCGLLEIQPPLFITGLLDNVSHLELAVPEDVFSGNYSFDRSRIHLQDVRVDEFTSQPEAIAATLRPMFDSLWQAAALPRCLHYDSAGNYDFDTEVW